MTLWLLALAALPTTAAPVHAERIADLSAIAEGKATPRHKVNFRLVQEPDPNAVRGRRSGMIVQRNVMRNGVLGFGLFKLSPRKFGDTDSRVDAGPSRSRKATVRFELKF